MNIGSHSRVGLRWSGLRRVSVSLVVAAGAAALAMFAGASSARAADTIYWGNWGSTTIGFAKLDGSGGGGLLNTSPVTPDAPDGLAIDSATGQLYWANYYGHSITFASLAGGAGGTFTAPGATAIAPQGTVVDLATKKIYWANFGDNTIEYAKLDGSGGGQLKTKGAVLDGPANVTIDPANQRLYWANYDGDTIYSVKLNNTGGGQKLNTGSASIAAPQGIAIDPSTAKLYWANSLDNTHPIAWAKTDNSGKAGNLHTKGATADFAYGVALDPTGGKLYWANCENDTISFANLNGTGGGQLGTSGSTPACPAFPVLLKRPQATAAPKITGKRIAGAILSCTKGKWAPDLIGAFLYQQPASFAYGWKRNGKPIAGATKRSITTSSAGSYTCTVTANNHAGSTKKTSVPHKVT